MHKKSLIHDNHISRTLEIPIRVMLKNHDLSSHVCMFTYARHYSLQELTTVTSHFGLTDDRFKLKIALKGFEYQDGIYLLDELYHGTVRELHYEHNAYNNLMILKNHQDYIEIAIFAMAWEKKNSLSFYFNNINKLYSFVDEFNERFKQPIHEIDKERIIIPPYLYEPASDSNLSLVGSLSHQEKKCFYHLVQGSTREQIAKHLNISRSTVGTYIQRIMHKFGCHHRSDLIEFAFKQGYLKWEDT